jgi:hypothetical protein
MGQAKNRKAEIEQLKKSNKDFGVLDFMYELGDGSDADDLRISIMSQIFSTMVQNRANLMSNAAHGKTTKAEGIQVGFDKASMRTISDYHVSVRDFGAFQAIAEFAKSPKLQMGMYADKSTKVISPAFFFQSSTHSVVISKWAQGTLIDFIPNDIMQMRNFSENAASDIDSFVRS